MMSFSLAAARSKSLLFSLASSSAIALSKIVRQSSDCSTESAAATILCMSSSTWPIASSLAACTSSVYGSVCKYSLLFPDAQYRICSGVSGTREPLATCRTCSQHLRRVSVLPESPILEAVHGLRGGGLFFTGSTGAGAGALPFPFLPLGLGLLDALGLGLLEGIRQSATQWRPG